MVNALGGYWEQSANAPDSKMCSYFRSLSDDILTPMEKTLACKTYPRTPPKLIDLDLLDHVVEQIETHDYQRKGPLLQVFSTMMLHLPMAYPAEYNEAAANDNYTNGMPSYFAKDRIKKPATIDDSRWATNKGVSFIDDVFGRTMQAVKDAGQWNNTIVYFTSDNGGVVYLGTANNNYPLRASKFSPFEGAFRAVLSFLAALYAHADLTVRLTWRSQAVSAFHSLLLEDGLTSTCQLAENAASPTPTSFQTTLPLRCWEWLVEIVVSCWETRKERRMGIKCGSTSRIHWIRKKPLPHTKRFEQSHTRQISTLMFRSTKPQSSFIQAPCPRVCHASMSQYGPGLAVS
jgi:Sulfatase